MSLCSAAGPVPLPAVNDLLPRGTTASRPAGLAGTALKEGNDRCFQLLERLVRTWRRLQLSLSVDQENGRITDDISIKPGDLAPERENWITYFNLFEIFALQIEIFVRQSKNNESLI